MKINIKDWRLSVKTLVKVLAQVSLLLLAAYGLRQMFTALRDELSTILTVAFITLLAYVIHI